MKTCSPIGLIILVIPALLQFAWAEPGATAIERRTPEVTATKDAPLINSLGMKLVPVAGTKVLFSIWETRIQDFVVFLKEDGRDFDTPRDWAKPDFQQGPKHPVVMINWHDAVAFCKWLSKKEGREYRLPTDAEWSVAVGSGSESEGTPEDKGKVAGKLRIYPWGKPWPPTRGTGNYADVSAEKEYPGNPFISGYDDGFGYTSPVGSFSANQFGLFDISGNVWEWCEDWYNEKNQKRFLRGGSWNYGDEVFLRSGYRMNTPPSSKSQDFGFRCVLVISR